MDNTKIKMSEISCYFKVHSTIEYIVYMFKLGRQYKNFKLSDQVTAQIYIIGGMQMNISGYDRHRWSQFVYLINKKDSTLPTDFESKFQEMILNSS